MLRQYELVERVKSYDPTADEEALNRAYVFAMKMHTAQKRESGDPYISHPVEVAGILTDYRLDAATIITALLHDTVEDTPASYADIKLLFGEDVANLVEGVTKLSKVQIQSEASKQAENFRKLVLAMSQDIRVLLIKLADRLHNMRTLHFCKSPEKRKRIATETMEIYVPLAERIGMEQMKNELEDLAFQTIHPEAYESIKTRLDFLREQGKDNIKKIITALKADLKENGIKGDVSGREKRPYSIWRKMQKQNIPFEQICDIMAFRIIVSTLEDCYKVLGVIHTKYPMIPGRYKDYISTPKPNGYRSIHTGVLGPTKHRIEIQIRTKEMHEVAELGLAAHWQYKQGVHRDGKQYRWLRDLLDLLNHAQDPNEFLEHTKIAMYQDQVFCFTPKGDLITLPKGATALDFAYAVHSRIGDSCIGVKINGRISPVRTILQNGDQVDIMTSKSQHPSPEWERFAVTARAKSCIRRYLRAQKREQFIELGRQMFANMSRENDIPWSDKSLEPFLADFKQNTIDDLLAAVGEGLIPFTEVFRKIHPEHKLRLKKAISIFKKSRKPLTENDTKTPIKGLIPGISLSYAKCCHPIVGDAITGIVTTGKGITIHTKDCEVLKKFKDEPERWLDVEWNRELMKDKRLPVRIKLSLSDRPGALTEVLNILARYNSNVENLNTLDRSGDWTDVNMDISVLDTNQLDSILNDLNSLKIVSNAHRLKL